ncbi:MAG: hypothetical protein ACKVS9_03820 [Phycisphaerae bacterium]
MSSMPGGSFGSGRPGPADNDIYTVLALIGFLAGLIAMFYVIYRASTLFGSVIAPGGS